VDIAFSFVQKSFFPNVREKYFVKKNKLLKFKDSKILTILTLLKWASWVAVFLASFS